MDGGHFVVFEVSVKYEDDPYLCILEKREKEHFPQGTRIRERRITSLIDLHLDEIPSLFFFFTLISLLIFVLIGKSLGSPS